MTPPLEHIEHDVVEQLGVRLARAQDVGAPLARTTIAGLIASDVDEPLNFGQWMAIAAVAAKQAVILRVNEETTPA